MQPIDTKNALHAKLLARLLEHLEDSSTVLLTKSAERDMSVLVLSEPVTKIGLLECMQRFIDEGKTLFLERQDFGVDAFVFRFIRVEDIDVFVKAHFGKSEPPKLLIIFAAHPDRIWS